MRRSPHALITAVLAGVVALAVAIPSAQGAVPQRSATARAAATKPLAGIIIAIDPGHNGGTAGHAKEINRLVWVGTEWKPCQNSGTATNAGYAEHKFTLLLARKLRARLVKLGATVKLTRNNDTGWGPCSTDRGRFGAKVHADLMISLHGDGLASSQHGFVVIRPGYVKGYTDDILARSKTLAFAIRTGLTRGHISRSTAYGGDGLDTRTDLGTLNLSDVPAVLVELGNMRNAHDAHLMSTSTGQSKYADGLVIGIRRFLHR